MAFTVKDFLTNPRPTLAGVDAVNPAKPFPEWQATGVQQPIPVARKFDLWNQAQANAFPPTSLVKQPRRVTITP